MTRTQHGARLALWQSPSPSGLYFTAKSQLIRPSFRCSLCGLDCLKVSQRYSNLASWSVSYLDLSQTNHPQAEGALLSTQRLEPEVGVIWDASCSSRLEEQDVSDDAAEKSLITWENLGCVSKIIIRGFGLFVSK